MIFSSENAVITVALQISCDASTGIQFLSFSYDAEHNAYIVHRHPFRSDIAISQVILSPDFSGGLVTIHFHPSLYSTQIPVDYRFSCKAPHSNAAFRCDREQTAQYEPACVHPPCFVTPDAITLIS